VSEGEIELYFETMPCSYDSYCLKVLLSKGKGKLISPSRHFHLTSLRLMLHSQYAHAHASTDCTVGVGAQSALEGKTFLPVNYVCKD